jgi:hypothetical protein
MLLHRSGGRLGPKKTNIISNLKSVLAWRKMNPTRRTSNLNTQKILQPTKILNIEMMMEILLQAPDTSRIIARGNNIIHIHQNYNEGGSINTSK